MIKSNFKIFEDVHSLLFNNNKISLSNLNSSAISFLINYLKSHINSPFIIISNNLEDIDNISFDIENYFDCKEIINLNFDSKNLSDIRDNNNDLLSSLKNIDDPKHITICQPNVLKYELPKKEDIDSSITKLKRGESKDFENFKIELSLNGFDRNDYVTKKGEFSVRGGIIDLFPIASKNPIRLEFWGNEIDSIREFNLETQRSINQLESIEFLSKILYDDKPKEILSNYINDNFLVFVINPDSFNEDEIKVINELQKQTNIILINKISHIDLKIKIKRQKDYKYSFHDFSSFILELINESYQINLLADGDNQLYKFQNLFYETIALNPENPSKDIISKKINWQNKTISEGFILPDEKIAFLTEHEVFGRKRRIASVKDIKNKFSLDYLKELNIGDFVVHEDKGICKFEGFKTVNIGSSYQDCIQLAFEGGDRLFVNLNYIQKIQKYSAQESDIPRLSKLGSTEWLRKKNRIKKKIKDISRDLIKLYAKRKMKKGFSFESDNVWQKEFEASFIYEETPDQLKTTDEIKKDMESSQPMDRLVCGDVGFGKTEIAIRAAFKAVQSGKQVAVLVPTTILAQQHYMSFKDRIGKYPINVEVISRFRTKKEQTKIIDDIKNSNIDILIGTHRILSKDIEFSNLGLLIVDEEQRFGVSAKEKLRSLKEEIDTLTLTATPIPRTLNFSLMGARDLSIIETPPRNRIPIKTEVSEWDESKILEVIEKELIRNGQVFFVNDTIQDLESLFRFLKMSKPELKIAMAHGQIPATKLEKIMEEFVAGNYSVLLTTKIVESGLDIPNANTMIINNAQNFGLAELYQLRGRVGRTNKQAYCYLFIPSYAKLNENSVKRLQAIEEFTDLGSGFQLSLRDLEIRGAGNLLGAEQSGAVFEIGFELYQKILTEAVNELKDEEFKELFGDSSEIQKQKFFNKEINIELDVDAKIPELYINSDTERFSYYKKLYAIEDMTSLQVIVEEFKDKYGKIPNELNNLIFVIKLRINSFALGFDKLSIKNNQMIIHFPSKENEDYYNEIFPYIIDFVQSFDDASFIQKKDNLQCKINLSNRFEAAEILWKINRNMKLEAIDYLEK